MDIFKFISKCLFLLTQFIVVTYIQYRGLWILSLIIADQLGFVVGLSATFHLDIIILVTVITINIITVVKYVYADQSIDQPDDTDSE